MKKTLLQVQEGLDIVKSKIDHLETTSVRPAFHNKWINTFDVIERKLKNLLENFHTEGPRQKRGIAMTNTIVLGTFVGVAGIGFFADVPAKVNTLVENFPDSIIWNLL